MDYSDILKKFISCPTLILAGTDHPNHPLASAKELAERIRKEFCYFKPISSPVYQDRPEEFNTLVSEFLAMIHQCP